MNGLIPTLIVVLLAEAGGALATIARTRGNLVAFAIGALIFVASGVGWSFAPIMAGDARLLMLAVLMGFSGFGQIWAAPPPPPTLWGTAVTVFRSPAPGLAFGAAAFFAEPFTPALGALTAVILLAAAAAAGYEVGRPVRRALGAILLVGGVAAGGTALVASRSGAFSAG